MNPFLTQRVNAAERIDHQRDDFGRNIEALVAQILNDIDDPQSTIRNLDGYAVVVKLQQLIFQRLNMKVEIRTTKHTAAILPFYSNKNHVFLSEFLRGAISLRDQNKVIAAFKDKSGYVNLHNATLGGIFSEYKHQLYLNFRELRNTYKMEANMIAAIILHELGHGFDACSYADRTDENNQSMANILRVVTNHNSKDDVEYVYRELSSMNKSVTKEEADKIVNGSKVVAGATWFKLMIGTVKSQLREDSYNQSAFEESADAFAARFGYGKELTLALDILHRGGFEKSDGARHMAYILEFGLFAALACGVLAAIVGGGAVMALYLGVMSLVITRASGDDMVDYTYDTLKQRYLRIRKQAVDFLKDNDLPADVVKGALASIDEIDKSIDSTTEYKSLFKTISNFVFSSARAAEESIAAQQMMETLASNDLFVEAARFKTL